MKRARRSVLFIPAVFLIVLWVHAVRAKEAPGPKTADQLEDARRQSQGAASSGSEDSSAKAGKVFQGSVEQKSDLTLLKLGGSSGGASLKSTAGDDSGTPLFTQTTPRCPEGSVETPEGGCITGEEVTPEECKVLADKAKTGFWASLLLFLGAAGLIGLGVALGWTGAGLAIALAGGVLLMAAGAFLAHQGTKSREALKQDPLCAQDAASGKGIGGLVFAAGEGAQASASAGAQKAGDAVTCAELMRQTGQSAAYLCSIKKAGQCCGYDGGGGGDGKQNCTCPCGQVVRLVSCTDQTAQTTCASTCRDKGKELCAHNWGASSPGYAECVCSFRKGAYDKTFKTCLGLPGIKEACASSDNGAYLSCIAQDGCAVPKELLGKDSGRQAYQDCLKSYLAPAKKADAEYLCKDMPAASKAACACSLQDGKLDAKGTCLLPCGSAFYDPGKACCSKGSVLQDQILGTDGKCTAACDGRIGLVRRADGTCGCPGGKLLQGDGTCVQSPEIGHLPETTLQHYDERDKKDLQTLVKATSMGMGQYFQTHPAAIADLCSGWPRCGSVSNWFQGFHYFWDDKVVNKLRAGLGLTLKGDLSEDINRYCTVLQDRMGTIANEVKPAGTHLEVKHIDLGNPNQTQGQAHHAIIVFPKGTDYKESGVVLDSWDSQSANPKHMAWSYPAWARRFSDELKYGERLR